MKVVVATHKPYPMPKDPLYLPLQVGAEGKTDENGQPLDFGYAKDNTGENISEKNPGYCELTGLYWAWKNLDEDYIGLVHYRRYFASEKRACGFGRITLDNCVTTNGSLTSKKREIARGFFNSENCELVHDLFAAKTPEERLKYVLTEEELRPLLGRYRIFIPKKRNYVIETLYSHYAHTHYAGHLDLAREVLLERYPEYLESFDLVMNRRWGYMFNMAIMRRDELDRYCTVLFELLFEMEKRLACDAETRELSAYQSRLYGRVAELFFNVWLDHELRSGALSGKKVRELPLLETERADWARKGSSYLRAKFLHEKYRGSF